VCLQLLSSAPSVARLAAFHSVMEAATAGHLPPDHLPGGASVQCVGTLSFLVIFLGWVLPTYFVLKTHQAERQLGRSGGGWSPPHAGSESDTGAHGGMFQASGSSGQGSTRGGLASSSSRRSEGGIGSHPQESVPTGSQPPQSRRHQLTFSLDTAVQWSLDNLFMEGDPCEQRMLAWLGLAATSWMLATLCA